MAKRPEAEAESLSFKDRSLSKVAAGELLNADAPKTLGSIIDNAVLRIKSAKTAKAEQATDAQFSRRHPSMIVGRMTPSPTGRLNPLASLRPSKPRELA